MDMTQDAGVRELSGSGNFGKLFRERFLGVSENLKMKDHCLKALVKGRGPSRYSNLADAIEPLGSDIIWFFDVVDFTP